MTADPTTKRARRSPARRIATGLGIVMILGGLGVIAWVAWQYFGTNIVAKHKQAEIKQSIKVDWGKGIDSDAVGLLRVERFGKNYEMPIVKGMESGPLARGVGWDPKSAKPGQIGNFVLAGHRVTHGEPFAKFPKLKAGDRAVIETRTGIYTYKLRNSGTSITVDFTEGWPLWNVPDPDGRGEVAKSATLTMVTCSELFHTRNRSVVIGDLIKTVKKTADNTLAKKTKTD